MGGERVGKSTLFRSILGKARPPPDRYEMSLDTEEGSVNLKDTRYTVVDLAGHKQVRKWWEKYYDGTDDVFFLIDVAGSFTMTENVVGKNSPRGALPFNAPQPTSPMSVDKNLTIVRNDGDNANCFMGCRQGLEVGEGVYRCRYMGRFFTSAAMQVELFCCGECAHKCSPFKGLMSDMEPNDIPGFYEEGALTDSQRALLMDRARAQRPLVTRVDHGLKLLSNILKNKALKDARFTIIFTNVVEFSGGVKADPAWFDENFADFHGDGSDLNSILSYFRGRCCRIANEAGRETPLRFATTDLYLDPVIEAFTSREFLREGFILFAMWASNLPEDVRELIWLYLRGINARAMRQMLSPECRWISSGIELMDSSR